MAEDSTHQSCVSFSTGYLETLAKLNNAQMYVALRAVVDETPGLSRTLALAVRDQAIRELAAIYGAATSARRVTAAYARYLGNAWHSERDTGPAENAPMDGVLLFKIAMANSGHSIGYHQIRNILLGHRGNRI